MAEDERLPEFYVDGFRVTVTPYDVSMTLSLNPPHPDPTGQARSEPVCVVRMSLEHAKTVAMLLRRQLKNYEREHKLEIPLPPNLYTSLGIAKEDWGFD